MSAAVLTPEEEGRFIAGLHDPALNDETAQVLGSAVAAYLAFCRQAVNLLRLPEEIAAYSYALLRGIAESHVGALSVTLGTMSLAFDRPRDERGSFSAPDGALLVVAELLEAFDRLTGLASPADLEAALNDLPSQTDILELIDGPEIQRWLAASGVVIENQTSEPVQ